MPVLEPGDRLLMPQDGEPALLENTKRNTPEMERKNMLHKIMDMKEKGKEFMSRITSIDGGDMGTTNDGGAGAAAGNGSGKPKPEKSMFFSGDELKCKH